MYRVIAVIGAGLALAACSSFNTNFDWLKSGSFRMEPVLETVRFESEPPGADVKTSTGQSCRTPCALALPGDKPLNVTFTLNGFQVDTESVEPLSMGDGTTQLRPNPVVAELTPLPPPPKKKVIRKRKPVAKRPAKPAAAKPAARKPAAPAASAPPPMAPQPAQAPSPWPSPAPASR